MSRSKKQVFVKDCIYRFIEIPDLCRLFLDTPEVQRLRDIKQLGFVHLVYPSAVHTRLEHSLGVMHLAGRVVDCLRKTGVVISDHDKDLLQLAGLLHDSGHVAYSHLLDNILKEHGYPDHEDRSVELLLHVNSTLSNPLSELDIKKVSAMIKGESPIGRAEGESCDKEENEQSFLYEMICNSKHGIDVDRLDYLQRDCYHTGMTGFQPDYLIECIRVDSEGHICFRKKAYDEVVSMYKARSHMFKTVYRHKTVIKAENTILDGIDDMDSFINNLAIGWMDMVDSKFNMFLRSTGVLDRVSLRYWNLPFEPITQTVNEDDLKLVSLVRFID